MGLRGAPLALLAGLLAVGLFAASPFLCDRLVGTGESYNYSLSVADALEQVRAGNIPPLVGQTRFAFNGRIHPLRSAPYLYFLAAAVDTATLHRLTFWQVQNASLAISLVCAVLACYAALRLGTDCPRPWAFFLSFTYGLSPPLLAAAYYEDLYMTVHAAVFVPLAIGACVRGTTRPSLPADACLAAALAAAWLAHPPVALWLTTWVGFVRLVDLVARPSWRAIGSGAAVAGLSGLLAAYAFISVGTLNADLGIVSGLDLFSGTVAGILKGVSASFPASILPVGSGAAGAGHLQFGYAAWILLITSVAALAMPCRTGEHGKGAARRIGATALALAAFLLILVVPVPGLTSFLWHRVPNIFLALTNLWPMQRLYLVAVPFTLFGAALILPSAPLVQRAPRWWVLSAAAAVALWTAWEAGVYLRRGFSDRLTREATESAYRPSNLDLTVTSFAYFGAPRTFVDGVMDPAFEFRLLRGGSEEVESPYAKAEQASAVVAQTAVSSDEPGSVTLQPKHLYLLTFDFRVPPMEGELELQGPFLHRTYPLSPSGSGVGFGMASQRRHSLTLWTDSSVPERIQISMSTQVPIGTPGVLAEVTLREFKSDDLPVRLEGLLPLRFSVDAPALGLTVETPRSFLSGYTASVNGIPVPVYMSPDRRVMVPVPVGRSEVQIDYKGSVVLRASFWSTVGAWIVLCAAVLAGQSGRGWFMRCVGSLWTAIVRQKVPVASATILALAAAALVKLDAARKAYDNGVGPIEIRFRLPFGKVGFSQPLLRTGHIGAAVVVFARTVDEKHGRFGADVWGQLLMSEPVELDFSAVHQLVVSDSALYPLNHPRIRALSASETLLLRRELRLELDGRTLLRTATTGFETTLSEIEIGRSSIGSLTDHDFSGQIVGFGRLPLPRYIVVSDGRGVRMTIAFPEGRVGRSEPLLCCTSGSKVQACYATYLEGGRIRITSCGPDGRPTESAEFSANPGATHVLEFVPGDADERSLAFRMRCSIDGRLIFEAPRLHAPDLPVLAVPGTNEAKVPGVLDRFTGPLMETVVFGQKPRKPPFASGSPVHLIVNFPEHKSGRSEPLLTTGRTGAGDLVYVTYVDDGHLKIGHDHWGVGGTESELIPVDYGVPHELWIDMRSLHNSGEQGAGPGVAVILDAKQVLTSPSAIYPSSQKEITILQNRIGASTADTEFSGLVHFSERSGVAAP